MTRYFDTGNAMFKLERTNSGLFHLTVVNGGSTLEYMFSSEVDALREIVSYAETDEHYFNWNNSEMQGVQ